MFQIIHIKIHFLISDKVDPHMKETHIGRISRVYAEANLSGTIGPIIEMLANTNGSSPI